MNHPQSATWERLLKVLAEAQAVFQQYGVLLFQEAHSLRIMDQPKLVEVNSQKEQVLDTMRRLEKQVEGELHQLVGAVASRVNLELVESRSGPTGTIGTRHVDGPSSSGTSYSGARQKK